MSSRFHNKWHRHNHHTDPIGDPRFPDASHDPIASPESPFRGSFNLLGPLSAYSSSLSSAYGAFITNNNIALILQSTGLALSANGGVSISGNLTGDDIFGRNFYINNNPTSNVVFGYAPSYPSIYNYVYTNFNTVAGLTNTIQASPALSTTSTFNIVVGTQNNVYNSFEAVALGHALVVSSLTSVSVQQDSIAIGNANKVIGNRSTGIGTFVEANGTDTIVIGSGVDEANPLLNAQPSTLALGVVATNPTVIVTPTRVGINLPNNGLPTTTLHVAGSARIEGDLFVDGSFSYLDTQVIVTSSADILNTGTGPALKVRQTGEQPVANFFDDNNSALYIAGVTSAPGYVGINTENPNHRLTVVGTISSTDGLITNSSLSANSANIGSVNISLSTVQTFATPLTATGDFLVLTLNGQPKAIRLWNYL